MNKTSHKLHRFFPLLWITVLKFVTLHAEIEIREVGLTMAIHSNSESSSCGDRGFRVQACMIAKLDPLLSHLQRMWIW
jgi:hypothetical protein